MIDISFYLPAFKIGGAERVIVNLANEFHRRGYKVEIVAGRDEGKLRSDVRKNINIVETFTIPFPLYQSLGDVPYLIWYLKKRNPTHFYSAMNHINIPVLISFILSSSDSTNLTISEHNDPSLLWDHSWKNRFLYGIGKYLYPKASNIIAVSKGVADNLSDIIGIPPSEIYTIYNPVVSDQLLQQRHQSVDHEWFQSDDYTVVLGVGRLHKQKRFKDLIKAFAQCAEPPNRKLVIIGDGPQRSELERTIQNHNIRSEVELISSVDNIYAYLNAASVFVLSSGWEGFGNVIVEAMACGCPVVSTNCPSGPAEILGHGEFGKLVPVGDTEAMAAAIRYTLLEDIDSRQLRDRANYFHVETIVDQYEKFLFST